MRKLKTYYRTVFRLNVVRSIYETFIKTLGDEKLNNRYCTYEVDKNGESWDYENFEDFIANLKKANGYALTLYHGELEKKLVITANKYVSTVSFVSNKKEEIDSIFLILEENLGDSVIKIKKDPVKIFIGHGHDSQWKDLKDHLHEQQGFDVIAYEIGPRVGLSIKDVLESMLNNSSFALLLLTGEDIDGDGKKHARENVIHELGLFQGRLGFTKSIALLEHGVNEFSNILGINQIRFNRGNIRETYGDILATIKREFE